MKQQTNFANRPATWLLAAGLVALAALTACDSGTSPKTETPPTRSMLLDSGEVYFGDCMGCHGPEGRGYAGSTPPLANSDFFMSNRQRVIAILLNGTSDSVFVNGIPYQGDMPSWKDLMTDFQIASVLTYIRAVLNDSTVTSCQPYDPSDPATLDPEGFA